MKRTLVFLLIAVVLAAAAYALLRWATPEFAKQIALYAVGLGAFVVGAFKKVLSFFGSDRALDRAEARNDEIRAELERIKVELAKANQAFESEREAHRREIERLENRLARQRQEADSTAGERRRLREMDLDEYLESLSPEDRRRIEADMLDGVIDGSILQ